MFVFPSLNIYICDRDNLDLESTDIEFMSSLNKTLQTLEKAAF